MHESKTRILKFADCNREFEDSKIVILGVPFDATSSFRAGSKLAPNTIREVSWNFESYILDYELDLSELPICDLGNLEEYATPKQILDSLSWKIDRIIKERKIPVLIGGEHTLTIGAVKAFKNQFKNISIVILDAHLDFRDEYLGVKYSHACTTRKVYEILGNKDRIFVLGVRSLSKEEKEAADKLKFRYYSIAELKRRSIAELIEPKEPVYLSIDFDVLDTSFAPGVANPEPMGLNLNEVLECIKLLSHKLVGFDLVEVCPPYDNNRITSILAAKAIQYLVASVWKNNLSKC
jgi:agmatinase